MRKLLNYSNIFFETVSTIVMYLWRQANEPQLESGDFKKISRAG